MKKIGISFIILNIAVVLGSAAVISRICHVWLDWDFLFMFLVWPIIFAFPVVYFYIENNKITDHIVNQTVNKNMSKYNFDKPYTLYVNNAIFVIDTESGRIAYISNLNPWKFQLISAKDIEDIKKDYKKGLFPETTNYVYFQFSYRGKVMKFPTFTSRTQWSIERSAVQDALKKATVYADVLRAAKQVMSNEEERITYKITELQQADVEQETQKNVIHTREVPTSEEEEKLRKTYGKWLFRVAGIILCINVFCRMVDAGKSMEYVQVIGTVTMKQTTEEWVRAGNRSFKSPTYIVWIEYPIKGYNSSEKISERYSFDMFSKGDKVPVLYRKDAASKAYVAKKDWMTGAYLPVDKYYNVPLIIAAILLIIGFLLYTNSPLLKRLE